jgi:hypothetical protein
MTSPPDGHFWSDRARGSHRGKVPKTAAAITEEESVSRRDGPEPEDGAFRQNGIARERVCDLIVVFTASCRDNPKQDRGYKEGHQQMPAIPIGMGLQRVKRKGQK